MKLLRLIIIFSLLITAASAQSPDTAGYRNDLRMLKKSLETKYPSLYRFKEKSSIDGLFEKCIRETDRNTSERDFYKMLKLILSAIEDGHLSCSPPDRLLRQFDETEKYFPLSLYFTEQKSYVDCSRVDGFAAGTEIIEINGIGVRDIRKNLFKYIVSDGRIETKKYRILNHSFWFYFNLVYGPHARYEIKCKNTRGQLFKTEVEAVCRKDMQCRSLLEENNSKLLDLKFLQPDVGLLTLRTFSDDDLENAGLSFTAFLKTAFSEIKKRKAASLIIDLRGNGGGRDIYGSLLYSYISDTAFRYYQQLETVSGVLDEKQHPNLSIQQPGTDHFSGKVYVLINGLSFSATSEFCTVARNNHRATFIGEETGGTYCGNTSGDFTEIVLPYSRFTVSLPTTRYTMVTMDPKNKDRGIMPDYAIDPTIEDLIDQRDVQLNLSIGLARKNRSR